MSDDLRRTDPAWWSTVRADWRGGTAPDTTPRGKIPILFTGRLRGMPTWGVPPQYSVIRHYCGSRVANDSYVVISGPRGSDATQGAEVFLIRQDHLLLYYEYP